MGRGRTFQVERTEHVGVKRYERIISCSWFSRIRVENMFGRIVGDKMGT